MAKFVGENNHRNGTVLDINGQVATISGAQGEKLMATTSQNMKIGDNVEVFVRPEAIAISLPNEKPTHAENGFDVVVKEILFDGSRSQLVAESPQLQSTFSVQLPQTENFRGIRAGDPLFVHWQSAVSRCMLAER
ncbi:TOBE domain-containing protein [Enterovibrio nigricans]|uniref:TOBE domain-containing protein n=1 Tax=Enterovibrio nigricans DSM 22720 TaxID=1121868 RepID=A0A1T4VIL5_9GAMM|nr:TOBE domain-containing protein [Enterovibrio nigricans]SKA64777.1 TOBE domain-containing protein [Enterovibrio nigricans DSM 22720]